jgi:hypothetical protein
MSSSSFNLCLEILKGVQSSKPLQTEMNPQSFPIALGDRQVWNSIPLLVGAVLFNEKLCIDRKVKL